MFVSVELDAARFSDGVDKPIEAVAKGECRARVDIEKLNARTNMLRKKSGENDGMVNLGKKIWHNRITIGVCLIILQAQPMKSVPLDCS